MRRRRKSRAWGVGDSRNNNNKRQTANRQTNKLQSFPFFPFLAVDKITPGLDGVLPWTSLAALEPLDDAVEEMLTAFLSRSFRGNTDETNKPIEWSFPPRSIIKAYKA